jgi:hypothetical protein
MPFQAIASPSVTVDSVSTLKIYVIGFFTIRSTVTPFMTAFCVSRLVLTIWAFFDLYIPARELIIVSCIFISFGERIDILYTPHD